MLLDEMILLMQQHAMIYLMQNQIAANFLGVKLFDRRVIGFEIQWQLLPYGRISLELAGHAKIEDRR